jgi:hypothetical protein
VAEVSARPKPVAITAAIKFDGSTRCIPDEAHPEFTAAGGLMSYGGSLTESYQTAGVYAGRILKGEKPADLPVQQVTEVEFYINGISVSLPLSGRADVVIEKRMFAALRSVAIGPNATSDNVRLSAACGGQADISRRLRAVALYPP